MVRVQFSRLAIDSQPFPGHTTDDYDIAVRRKGDALRLLLRDAKITIGNISRLYIYN